ncbi:hypothetical protein BDR26DRAFT_871000 [Obelidium mucronatum]|nr:hypothetical protein BDR26DRAFT_871000 [Obelidium mucronatum]
MTSTAASTGSSSSSLDICSSTIEILKIESSPGAKLMLVAATPDFLKSTLSAAIPPSPTMLMQSTEKIILYALNSTRVHKFRLLYILGVQNHTGGTKRQPGYRIYDGKTPSDLLTYIVTSLVNELIQDNTSKALQFVADSVNRILELQYNREKDLLDDLFMKGMQKSGHIGWTAVGKIPEHLRHANESLEVGINSRPQSIVEFTPRRSKRSRLILE